MTSHTPTRKMRGVYKKSNLVRGVGVNDADYPVVISTNTNGKNTTVWACPYYSTWSGMLRRAYSKDFQAKYPAYVGCSVVPEWHTFSVFRRWMATQPWEGNQLDKDLLVVGNKVYGPETCVFVSGALNRFLVDQRPSRGLYPLGVSRCKRTGLFRALCRNPFLGRHDVIGSFICPNEAHNAWVTRKNTHAQTYAAMQADKRVAEALMNRFASS